MTVEQDAHGSFQVTLPTGVDVVYHGDLSYPTFDVTIRDETTRIVYGDARPVPIPYRTVVELRTAIAADPVMFTHEAIIHVARHRLAA